MLVNDTALAAFVRDFGDLLMEFFAERIYQSPLAQLVIYIAGIFFLCSIAISFFYPSFIRYWISFLIAWILLSPYQNKPVFYYIVNTFSIGTSTLIQGIIHDLFTHFSGKKGLPPNYVYNSIYRAATTTIKDPQIRKDILFLIENCIPYGKNNRGITISAADILSGKITTDILSGTNSIVYPFEPSYLENLKNRVFEKNGNRITCFSLLESTTHRLRGNLLSDLVTNTSQLFVGANNGESKKTITTWKTDKTEQDSIGQMSLNLAHATSIQQLLLEDVFNTKLSYRNGTDKGMSPVIDLSKTLISESSFNPTKIMLNVLNTPTSIGRYFNIDGFYSSAQGLQDMNERLYNLPYYISYVQIFLKIAVILLLFSALFGSWRFITLWATCWFLTLNVPWILMLSRIISNLILIHALKLKEQVSAISQDANFLTIGVDFYAATKMLDDTSRMMNVFINCENAIWGSLFFIIPAAGWFASGRISNAASAAIGHLGGMATRKMAASAGKHATSLIKTGGMKLLTKSVPIPDKISTLASSIPSKPFKEASK